MAITTDDFNKIWASASPLTPYSFSASQYKEGWNFIGGTPPSRQMWDFLQKNNDEKMQYLLNNFDNYLPLSGGTLTGVVNGVTPPNGDNSKKLATTEFVNATAQEAKDTAQEAKDTAQEAKDTAQEAKDTAQEAKDTAQEAKDIAQSAKDTLSNLGAEIVTKLAQTTTVTAISALQTNSWFGQLLKLVLTASGVRYNIADNGYVCLGDFFGGLIIQWVNTTITSNSNDVVFPLAAKVYYAAASNNGSGFQPAYSAMPVSDGVVKITPSQWNKTNGINAILAVAIC